MTTNRRGAGRKSAQLHEPDIRERLVQAAHDVLVEHGLTGFKVLDVAARAKANVAMINYHFGGRDGLLDEVVRMTGTLIAEVRSANLARLLSDSAPRLPAPETVMRCWLEPMFESVVRANNREVMMLMIHQVFAADVSPERKNHLLSSAMEVTNQFLDVLSQCRPDIPRPTLAWRMICAVGSCYIVLGQREPMGLDRFASQAAPVSGDRFEQTLAFIMAGMLAPA